MCESFIAGQMSVNKIEQSRIFEQSEKRSGERMSEWTMIGEKIW